MNEIKLPISLTNSPSTDQFYFAAGHSGLNHFACVAKLVEAIDLFTRPFIIYFSIL